MEALLLLGLVNGLVLGSLYSLLGVSLTIIYGVLKIKNFAHGEIVLVGSYLAYFALTWFGLHPFLALPIVFAVTAALGVVLYRAVWPSLQRSGDTTSASLLVMYGLSLVLTSGILIAFEADPRSLGFEFRPSSMQVGPVYIPTARLVALGCTVALVALTTWLLYGTLPGKALRGAMMNRDAIQLVGINVDHLAGSAFALSLGLAGATGVLMALVFPVFNPFVGVDYTLLAFVVVVLGGLGNPAGALVAGLLFGITEQLATVLLPQMLAPVVGFAMMITVLFLRPQGLFAPRSSGAA